MKRIIAILLSLSLLITLIGCGGTEGKKKKAKEKEKEQNKTSSTVGAEQGGEQTQDQVSSVFDEKNIVFSFGALSDIHLDGGYMLESSYTTATTSYRTLQEFADGKLDAVLIAGDLVNCTNSMGNVFAGSEKYPGTREENYPIQKKAEMDNFKKAVKDALPDDIALFFSLGNHDSIKNNHTAEFIEAFSAGGTKDRYFKYDVNMEETAQGLRHCIIGGYHFFGINLNSVGVQPYTQETYDWLRVEFDKILAEDKNANIFLAAHFGPDTSNAYKKEGEFGLKELLNEYPQVITFYGHDHDFIQKETSIMQYEGGFIALNCGSANYFPLKHPSDDLQYVNVTKKYVEQFFGGYLVQIDGEGDIRVRRINFKTGTICADDWIIPAAKNGKRELNYTMDRANKVEKPYFKEGTELLLKQTSYNLQVGFDAAICEDYIYYYKVEIFKEGSTSVYKQFAISSRLFGDKSKADAAKRFDIYVEPLEKGSYTVKLTPYDTFTNAGKAIEAKLVVS